jgi:GT2 family glycosyltransferase
VISVVVPTFRRPAVLERTLAALLAVDPTDEDYEVLVVDDGSGDRTPDVVAGRAHRRLRFFQQPNRGVASARNLGARQAAGALLVFIDDDIVVPDTFLRDHLALHRRFPGSLVNGRWEFEPALRALLAGSAFGRFRLEVEEWVKQGLAKRPLAGGVLEPDAVTACNLSLTREAFARIGGFSEDFPYAGAEDQEFSLRARRAGFRFVYDPELRVWHNDHRVTLEQFCERQRRGAVTSVLLARKHPQDCADRPLFRENGPVSAGDPAALRLRKVVKRLLSVPPVLAAVVGSLTLLERLGAPARLLRRGYWMACGLYIFAGIREGVARFGGLPPGRPATADA